MLNYSLKNIEEEATARIAVRSAISMLGGYVAVGIRISVLEHNPKGLVLLV